MDPDINILVVENDPDVLFATSRILQKAGYCVETANSGQEVIERAKQFGPERAAVMGIKGLLMKSIIKIDLAKTVRKVLDDAKD